MGKSVNPNKKIIPIKIFCYILFCYIYFTYSGKAVIVLIFRIKTKDRQNSLTILNYGNFFNSIYYAYYDQIFDLLQYCNIYITQTNILFTYSRFISCHNCFL